MAFPIRFDWSCPRQRRVCAGLGDVRITFEAWRTVTAEVNVRASERAKLDWLSGSAPELESRKKLPSPVCLLPARRKHLVMTCETLAIVVLVI